VASPTVVSITATTNGTTGVMNLGAASAGQLYLVTMITVTAPTPSAGWSTIVSGQPGSTTFARVFAKIATGSDSLTASGTANGGFCYVIDGWSGSISDLVGSATTTTLDPPAVTLANADNLWVASAVNFTNNITGYPTSYSGGQTTTSASGRFIATAWRQRTIATEDPGAFTATASTPGAWTVGIPPVNAPRSDSVVIVPPSQAVMRSYNR
jgi:hypothetical protein